VSDVAARVEAVLFDVDYTLLRPGSFFEAVGYERNGRRFGLTLDPSRWPAARRAAHDAVVERRSAGYEHDMGVIPAVTRAVVGALVTAPPDVDEATLQACADYVAAGWWDLGNFSLYPDARPCLVRLRGAGVRVGLVSNTSRSLAEVVEHFDLGEIVDAAVASVDVGLMKPAPAIFVSALGELGVPAERAVMVGDNIFDDVEGALGAGFAMAVLLDRGRGRRPFEQGGVMAHEPTITSLAELPPLLGL